LSKVSRRGFLFGGAAATGAIVASPLSAAAGFAAGSSDAATKAQLAGETAVLERRAEFYGEHQNGVELELQACTSFVGLTLLPETDLAAAKRWFSLLTDDISRLTRGEPILADATPQLAIGPAGLTVTVGISPEFLNKLGLSRKAPPNFRQLPSFSIDKLREEFSGGDVLLHVSADDPVVLSHAVRSLTRDSAAFATVKYTQQGFANAQGVVPKGVRQRNLMGQVDGTANPEFGTEDFSQTVWIESGPDWLVGGTMMVFRRIAMKLNTWDALGRVEKEQVIGRDLKVGAPLGQVNELDRPDFEATDANGLLVIPEFAHIRRAHVPAAGERIFRRPFNYDQGVTSEGDPDVGLLWAAYQRDIESQFLPIQRRLEQFDLLNVWTSPIGSAVFAILPGVTEGQILGEKLFA
jgi:dye decolorizing peroxidase